MKFGVVVFPGSNCDEDIVHALRTVLGQEVTKLWHKDTDLQGCDFIVVPGGFSYGDYLRSGAIARFSPIMDKVIEHANHGGYVLGICNGFQILTEAHLLPGALLHNKDHQFICRNAYIKPATSNTLLTGRLDTEKAYNIPVAHAEGRYFASQEVLKELQDNDQILFYYTDAKAQVKDSENFNGSVNNIAGVTNKNRNVFGMMPHPERATEDALGNTDGRLMLESLIQMAEQNN